MNVIREEVRHSIFGTGKVIEQNETMVIVKFGKSHGLKQFLYPSAFGTFLQLSNTDVQEKIDIKIKQMSEQAETDRVLRETERSTRRQEEELATRKAKLETRKRPAKSMKE